MNQFSYLKHPLGLRIIPASDEAESTLFAATLTPGAVTLTFDSAAQFLGEIITEKN